MKIAVDLKTCENHGQCTYVAPSVFALDDAGHLAFRALATDEYVSADLADGMREEIEEAIGMCPVQAIRELEGERA